MPPWLNVDYSNRSHVFLQKLTLKLGVIWNFQQDTFNKTQQKVFTLINRTIWILRNKTFWNFQHTMTDVSFHQYINSADEIRQQRLKSITGTKRQNSKLVFRLDFFSIIVTSFPSATLKKIKSSERYSNKLKMLEIFFLQRSRFLVATRRQGQCVLFNLWKVNEARSNMFCPIDFLITFFK